VTTFIVPPIEARPWPTLGPQVVDHIEDALVHGPGDIRGQPAHVDDETRGLIYRMYEVYPKDHPLAGRRRFKRVGISLAKGLAKTEKAAWLAACELHDEAPVRCDGWRKEGRIWVPVGAPVESPYIPMVAYTEEQTEDLAYAALMVVLGEGPLADDFDIGLERIMRISGDGKAVPLASAPNARDGALTTFQHFDETHRLVLPRHKRAHQTMLANIPKRKMADPWSLETTTSPMLGEGSVAEDTLEYARAVHEGRVKDSSLFFFHRQASDKHNLNTLKGARAAVVEASGDAARWRDINGIVQLWQDPTTDRRYWERVWTNRPNRWSEAWLPGGKWELLEKKRRPAGSEIVLGFDGSYDHRSAGLVGCTLDGHEFVLGEWDAPPGDLARDWRIPSATVDAAVADAMASYEVLELACDPTRWSSEIEGWAELYGDVVVDFPTNAPKRMVQACARFYAAVTSGQDLTHDGNEVLARHLHNATLKETVDGAYIVKEGRDSVRRINLATAAVIAYERAMWHRTNHKGEQFAMVIGG
jgi:phage terminase large subunit-like protein